MREIEFSQIVDTIADICISANIHLPECSMDYYRTALKRESDSRALSVIDRYLENVRVAQEKSLPLCQDTGTAVFFITLGEEVAIVGGRSTFINDAVNDGVKKGYHNGYLRKSIVDDPLFDRINTGDNCPAIIHLEIVSGDVLEIEYAAKGGGAENMSRLAMMPPSAGVEGVVEFTVETVQAAGGNPCPPVVIGIGIGGNFEKCALLAKKALFRETPHIDSRYASLEKRILTEVNNTGIGAQGFGGRVTAFDVHIEYAPCHIASMPVAVNLNCHVHRHAKIKM